MPAPPSRASRPRTSTRPGPVDPSVRLQAALSRRTDSGAAAAGTGGWVPRAEDVTGDARASAGHPRRRSRPAAQDPAHGGDGWGPTSSGELDEDAPDDDDRPADHDIAGENSEPDDVGVDSLGLHDPMPHDPEADDEAVAARPRVGSRSGELAARAHDALPGALHGVRLSVPVAAALGLLLLTGLAVLAMGLRTLGAAPPGDMVPERQSLVVSGSAAHPDPPPEAPGSAPPDAPEQQQGPTQQGAAALPAAPAAPPPGPVVHVVGQVLQPGIVRLDAGARVVDAVQAAGGFTPEADTGRMNLARAVVDGEQLHVLRPGEEPPLVPPPPSPAGGQPADVAPAAPGPGQQDAANAPPLDLNAAGAAELDQLPGVGPVLSQRILDWRATNGRFTSVEELREVAGIGEKVMEQLRPRVRV